MDGRLCCLLFFGLVMQQQLFSKTRFDQWVEFHLDNPHVFRHFRRFACEALDVGAKVGARLIGERIRWLVRIETESIDGFKVNNNHWPFYARALALTDDRFNDFFEFRQQAGKDYPHDAEIIRVIEKGRKHHGRNTCTDTEAG